MDISHWMPVPLHTTDIYTITEVLTEASVPTSISKNALFIRSISSSSYTYN